MKQKMSNSRLMKSAAILFALHLSLFTLAPAQTTPYNANPTGACPEVLIEQKYDHVVQPGYRQQGWDTAITCTTPTIELSAEPYIPVQFFNGYYLVEQIPYNPPDTTFSLGTRMPISTDDDYAASSTNIPYPFYFFGIRKNYFRLGANGLVTFTTNFGSGTGCAWSYSAPLPWPPGTSGAPFVNGEDRVRDAIYGIYEDTYPSPSIHTSGDPNWGIYYGIQDQFPCRKIICSWNDVPQFSCTSLRCSYQIVCYEGSNIIEVHVKQRQVCTSWNGGNGIIGIQNATGQPQVRSTDHDDPNYYVQNGAPAAFFPSGFNTSTQSHDTVAFRFTPQGTTQTSYKWYRIFDDGRDSVVLTTNQNDTNGYYIPMSSDATVEHATLTKAIVSPHCVSRYVCELRFMNANEDWYFLYDTITIGIDTNNTMSLKADGNIPHTTPNPNETYYDICQGHTTNVTLEYPSSQRTSTINWTVTRVQGGNEFVLPSSMYTVATTNHTLTLRPDPEADTLPRNKIDTIYVQASVVFRSGCQNYHRLMVRVFPNFDTVMTDGICNGETYTWHPCDSISKTFTSNTNPDNVFVTLKSSPGCDSLVHLALTVFDVSLTYEDVTDCKEYTWRNGQTYSETNTATSPIDTVVLKNAYNCDSVVQLRFTLAPVTAHIKSSLDHFDFDHLDVTLTDLSTGNDSRRWHFPTSGDQTGATAYYSIPVTLDEAHIWLTAYSPYGCADSTDIVIPFNKECFWVPNAFTPDDPAGNNIFSSTSIRTIYQEMFIYNRLGEMVYKCEGADCGWDGKHMNGTPCPQGAYVYVIRYSNSFEPKVIKVKRGTVTLIR